MTRGRLIGAALVTAMTVLGLGRPSTSPAGESYETLLPRVLAASGDPTFGDEAREYAMTYGLVAQAAVAVGDVEMADFAAAWLLDDLVEGGWGTAWTWDPYDDGSWTLAGTPYSITTAIAIEGLLDHGVDPTVADRIAEVLLVWARDGWSDGYYWFSLAPQDAIYTPNVSAMLAGVSARFLSEHPEAFSVSERDAIRDRVNASIARLATGDAGYLRWIYSDRHDIVNDLNHHGYILWGMELARDAGFEAPWSRADALASLDAYDVVYPVDAELTASMAGRYGSSWTVSGTGTALVITARWGGDPRPWARKACVALEKAPFYPRFAAHTLLGFALAGICDCSGRTSARDADNAAC